MNETPYLRPCPKCHGKNIRIWTVSNEVSCSDCGYAVDIPQEPVDLLYAKIWNSEVNNYISEGEN